MDGFQSRRHCRIVLACAGLLVATAMPQRARAAVILDQGNTSIEAVTGSGSNQLTSPYATLDISGDTTTGRVVFTLSTSAHNESSPINAVFSQVSFNTNLTLGSAFTLLSASNGNGISNGGNVSSFGSFAYTVGGAANADRANPFTFTLQLADFSQALPSNFELTNGLGNSFAAHMFTNIQDSGQNVTGFIAAGGSPNPVPEPATITVFLACLVPLGMMKVRSRSRRSAPDIS